ncbi:MAG: deoxyribodipyrimidine photo-lyase [Bacteriovoracaceae bacterium]|nr:deoxyribodipyrimidine photo-lyase [Bacteriovoracaceae bacterium]
MENTSLTLFWFRRDLRLEDNHGLYQALKNHNDVLPLFIFDQEILTHLQDKDDARVTFIHDSLAQIKRKLQSLGSDLLVEVGTPLDVFQKIIKNFSVKSVFTNHDYEPYALKRDRQIATYLHEKGISFQSFKDQCLLEKNEVLKNDLNPYTVFTPYKNKWLEKFYAQGIPNYRTDELHTHFFKVKKTYGWPSLEELGFKKSLVPMPPLDLNVEIIKKYDKTRDFPSLHQGTTHLGLHLRFGTISVRECLKIASEKNQTWLSELIWREFFMQILFHFPHVVKGAFRKEYDAIEWRSDEEDFKKWCEGKTGYPLVDAGMRELNQTGYMHNRVRMLTASFLCKHLLIDWRLGEAYFARKLLDFDLSANNGNWQWSAGTGCDAAPYFRIFNPTLQLKKFDPQFIYVKKWVPEWGEPSYVLPVVEHSTARLRVLEAYKKALKS